MKSIITLTVFIGCLGLTAFQQPSMSLKGVYEYQGGVYNGKPEGAPAGYSMRRTYDNKSFTAIVIQKGSKPQKYEGGNYVIKADSCLETATYNKQTPQLVGKTAHYSFKFLKTTLILSGKLPSGMLVVEYWKKVPMP